MLADELRVVIPRREVLAAMVDPADCSPAWEQHRVPVRSVAAPTPDLLAPVRGAIAEMVRDEAERIEGDLALAVSLQDFDRIGHLTVVEDRRRLDAWTRTVASSWPDPI